MPAELSAMAMYSDLMGMCITSVYGVERHFIRHICSIDEWEKFTVREHCATSSRKSQRIFFFPLCHTKLILEGYLQLIFQTGASEFQRHL